MDPKRLILFVVFSFSIMMLWEAWQREHQPPQPATQERVGTSSVPSTVNAPAVVSPVATGLPENGFKLQNADRMRIHTDYVEAEIDTMGGDLRRLTLTKHRATEDLSKNFVLLDDQSLPHVYVAQSGLIGPGMPNHKTQFTAKSGDYSLQNGSDKLEIRLNWNDGKGLQVDKVYTFHRSSYVVDVAYEIRNGGNMSIEPTAYYQIVHDSDWGQGSMMMPTFTGVAYFTDTEKYKKLTFSDMEKNNLSKSATDGWIGLVQHYFVGAWIPKPGVVREYYSKRLSEKDFSVGAVLSIGIVAPGASTITSARFYAGPQEQTDLKNVAPGLEYTVDYGWLTVIASPLFWVLSAIQKLVHNWGVAIILLTVLLKMLFYPLSAASYKSMAKMRNLAPRLQRLKEQFGDDRQKLHMAMMELYKTEKINPMGGCLPVVVQIPVFIALYWVLLGTVEMRHAPFMLWIHDLSAADPYYVLPTLMGITMFIQTKLNPTPPDPVQAKVMTIMPVAMSVFFFFFPAGLVLYWLVNNVLSIAQQWAINRSIDGGTNKGNAKA